MSDNKIDDFFSYNKIKVYLIKDVLMYLYLLLNCLVNKSQQLNQTDCKNSVCSLRI